MGSRAAQVRAQPRQGRTGRQGGGGFVHGARWRQGGDGAIIPPAGAGCNHVYALGNVLAGLTLKGGARS